MNAIQHILCATDLSDGSDQIINTAGNIAQTTHADLTIIHTVEQSQLKFLNFIFETEDHNEEQFALDELNKCLEETKTKLSASSIDVHAVLEQGSVSEAIHQHIHKSGANLLIIGAHERYSLEKLFLGSNALKILRKANCPVLVAKNTHTNNYQRVLIGVDFSQNINPTIEMVRCIAPDAEIVLAHFYEIPFEGKLNHYAQEIQYAVERYRTEIREDALKKMQAIADDNKLDPLKSTLSVVQGDAVDKLMFLSNDYDSDLIVLGKHGSNATEDWILGSVTNEILNICSQDILVMPKQSRLG